MKKYLSYFIIICSLSSFSCSVSIPSIKTPIKKTRTFSKSFDETWKVLVKILSVDGYPIKILEKNSGVLQTDQMQLSEQDAYAYTTLPQQSLGSRYYTGICNLKFFVQGSDTSSVVQITAFMQATFYVYKVLANVYENHELESNGVIEQRIFDKIQIELK